MKASELAEVLAVARGAAREAGRLVHAAHRRHPVVEHKGAVDLVTRYDRESEELLRARLSSLSLDIVGEEQGGTWDRARPTLFIDPIDGTTNFVHGHPFWCVSIGLVEEAEPTLGVVLAPALGLEWYGWLADDGAREAVRSAWGAASADGAARSESCTPSGVARLDDALLATGFPYDRRTSADNNFDAFFALKQRCQAVRRCGSAALDLCLVADGTYDGYWERKLKPWDIAGGIALVRAAGGKVTDLEGGEGCIPGGRVIATNGLLHAALVEALAASNGRSPASP